MKPYSLINTAFFALLDCLFCWLSWMGSVFVFTYLFVNNNWMINVVNRNLWIMVVACVLFYSVRGVYKSLWQHPYMSSLVRLACLFYMKASMGPGRAKYCVLLKATRKNTAKAFTV